MIIIEISPRNHAPLPSITAPSSKHDIVSNKAENYVIKAQLVPTLHTFLLNEI